ncbi:hypothetical protein DRO33_01195, partial [Candidatus Bathyarchaeota archaeon]
ATYFAFVGSIGWAIGVSLMGPVENALGPSGVFLTCLCVLLAFPLVLAFYREEELPRKDEPLRSYVMLTFMPRFRAERGFGFLLLGVFLSWLGLQWTSTARVKLYELLGYSKTLVGLTWAASSIISAFTVLAARRLVERLGGLRTLLISIACYTVVMPSLGLIWDPRAFVVLWLLPVWPFFNLGYVLSPAEFSREDYRGEAMGANEVAKNVGVLLGMLGGLVADLLGREVALVLSAIPFGLALAFAITCYYACKVRWRKAF